MLLVPLVSGFVVGWMHNLAGDVNFFSFLLLTVAMVATFFAYEPLNVLAKAGINPSAKHHAQRWLIFYLVIAAVSGLALLVVWQRWWLIGLAMIALMPLGLTLLARKWRKQRSLPVRLTGIAGLVVSAPVAYYLATANLNLTAFGLWIASLAYFGSTLFYVRTWFEAKKAEKQHKALPDWLKLATVGYFLISLVLLVVMIVNDILPAVIWLAYLPLLVKMAMAFRNPPIHIPIKQIGLLEFGQSFVFALLLILCLR
jgi:hypothetical protein